MAVLDIAVVGSGISGLSAAWLLSQRHRVTLFEGDNRLGGHANTVDCATTPVDTGFIVYNEATYPNLTALFDYLNVRTAPSQMTLSISLDGGTYEYAGSGPMQAVGQIKNLTRPGHWRLIADLVRFFRTAAAQSKALPPHTTLGEFLARHNYSQGFIDRHLLPMAGAIWSAAPRLMLDYPAKSFIRFFQNHGLLKLTNRPQWRTVEGGSRQYVRKLVADGRFKSMLNLPVTAVCGNAQGCAITVTGGYRQNFDHVVIATHADQALALLSDATDAERHTLSAFRYSRNRALLHTDASLMPKRRRLWSSWNCLGRQGQASSSITYWMNALQPLATDEDLFVSLNPLTEPDQASVKAQFLYEHPIFTAEAVHNQQHLWDLQGVNRIWFCGAYFGAGFHEDGLQSGLAVAEQLGGVRRPWTVADESGRICVGNRPDVASRSIMETAE